MKIPKMFADYHSSVFISLTRAPLWNSREFEALGKLN